MAHQNSVVSASANTERLRTHEAARYLALAPATLCKLRSLGGGPTFTKLGRAVVYDRRDLDAWYAARGKQNSTAETTA